MKTQTSGQIKNNVNCKINCKKILIHLPLPWGTWALYLSYSFLSKSAWLWSYTAKVFKFRI